MWQSLFVDMFENLSQTVHDQTESIVLAIHLFNVSNDFQCTGQQENDAVSFDILPQNWNANHQLYTFRYSFKSIKIYQKFLRINESKLNIYTIRSDRNDKIINFSINPSAVIKESENSSLVEVLIGSILQQYKENILAVLGLDEVEDPKDDESINSAPKLEKQKSLLHDESVPFGVPVVEHLGDLNLHHSGQLLGSHGGHAGIHPFGFHPINHAVYYPMSPFMYYPVMNTGDVASGSKKQKKEGVRHSAPYYHYPPHGFY